MIKRRRRRHIVEELNPEKFQIDAKIDIKDDITFLKAVDMYLLKLYRLRNGIEKGDEKELNILNILKEKISQKIEGESIAPDSFIERIIRKFKLRYDETLILSVLMIYSALPAEAFVSQYLSKFDKEDILDYFIDADSCRLTDIQTLIGVEKIINDESTIRRLVEGGLVDISYSTKIKLCGSDIRIKLSSVLMDLLNTEEDEDEDELWRMINLSKIEEEIGNFLPIKEEEKVKEILSEIENHLNISKISNRFFEPPKIILLGNTISELDIVSKVVAYTFKRDLFILPLYRDYEHPLKHFEPMIDRRNPLNRKLFKLLVINDCILRIDINRLSVLKKLNNLLEQHSDILKRFNSAIIITCTESIGNRFDEINIPKEGYKLIRLNKFSENVFSQILKKIVQCELIDYSEIIKGEDFLLKDIEMIGRTAIIESIINGEPMSIQLLKKAKDNLFVSLEERDRKHFESVRIEDTEAIIEYEVRERLDDVILNSNIKREIQNIIIAIKNKEKLYNDILGNLSYGKGIKALFYGNPGTGKTLTAKAIAGEVSKGLITINFAQLINKYVGETEKNIHNNFNIATETDSILFVDEADALIMNRDNLIRSYELSFINTLLKEIENFEGVLILSTNYENIRDRAINRRMHFFVKFENPDYENRIFLIKKLIPENYVRDINIEEVAAVPFNGGHLKNVWIRAGITILKGDKINTEFLISELKSEIEKEHQDRGEKNKKIGF